METSLQNFFLLVCLFTAGYMTILQFKYYIANDDVASISYRKFNSESKDQYPSITVCVRNKGGKLFKNSEFFRQSQNISELSYYKFLNGGGSYISSYSGINYDSLTDYVDDILIKGKFEDIYGVKTSWSSLTRMHQMPNRVCYSVKNDFQQNYTLAITSIYLNTTVLKEKELSIMIYIHQREELLQSKQDYILISDANVQHRSRNDIKIKGVEVLTKRPNGKIPCNASSVNENEVAREIIMKTVRCIPVFWMRFVSNSTIGKVLPSCNQDQYLKIKKLEELSLHLLSPADYLESCTRMTTTVESVALTDNNKNYAQIHLRFVYSYQWYKEIINNKAYTSETLCGQVGGFIGK